MCKNILAKQNSRQILGRLLFLLTLPFGAVSPVEITFEAAAALAIQQARKAKAAYVADDLPTYKLWREKAIKSYDSLWKTNKRLKFEGNCSLQLHSVLVTEITLALPLECTGIELAVILDDRDNTTHYREEEIAKEDIDNLAIWLDKYDRFAIKFRFDLRHEEDKATRKFIKYILAKVPEVPNNFGYKGCKTGNGGYSDENNAIMNASEACRAILGAEVYSGTMNIAYDKLFNFPKRTLRLEVMKSPQQTGSE